MMDSHYMTAEKLTADIYKIDLMENGITRENGLKKEG